MPLDIGLWRLADGTPRQVAARPYPLESRLEELLSKDPTLIGEPLLLVGRQVPTAYGGRIDLLAVDADGYLCVLELKRDRTPREVVAQLLDYASWLAEGIPDVDAVAALYADFDDSGQDFADAFEKMFGEPPPEDVSGSFHRLIVVAGKLDSATERIVDYLSGYDVPINAVLFQYFEDDGHQYLARTWVREDDAPQPVRPAKSRPAWNGQDWYVSFGEDSGRRDWQDARTYGFVSAGGGTWYTRTLRALPVGARIWTYIGGTGYVGVGEVVGQAAPVADATLEVEGEQRPFLSLSRRGTYDHGPDNPEPEYVVPVRWLRTVDREKAVREPGLFANQNSACKLRDRRTLEVLRAALLPDSET
jgi:hypothetical protein